MGRMFRIITEGGSEPPPAGSRPGCRADPFHRGRRTGWHHHLHSPRRGSRRTRRPGPDPRVCLAADRPIGEPLSVAFTASATGTVLLRWLGLDVVAFHGPSTRSPVSTAPAFDEARRQFEEEVRVVL